MKTHALARIALLSLSVGLGSFLGCAASTRPGQNARSQAGLTTAASRPRSAFARRWGEMTPAQRVEWTRRRYVKHEHRVPMRDGVCLFTSVYVPRDASPDKTYPILLRRTPYSCAPYGPDAYDANPGPAGTHYLESGYIFVTQDVRGRFMSEGLFEDMRPQLEPAGAHPAGAPGAPGALPPPTPIDESTDARDTIDWLVGNIRGASGRVGMWGISYPGFYASAGMINAHPALVAVAPMAPIGDWFFDDFFHHGAFFLPHNFNFFTGFGKARPLLTSAWGPRFEHGTPDGYQFFLDLGPLSNVNDQRYKGTIAYWNTIVDHPNYDEFWRARNILPRLRNIAPAVLTVGGWHDAEDLYGSLHTYQSAERQNPGVWNGLVMGPWFHGGWHRSAGDRLGNVSFGGEWSHFYQDHIEFPFFEHHLKGKPAPGLPEAYVFETGGNAWRKFDRWPPTRGAEAKTLRLGPGGALSFDAPDDAASSSPAYDEWTCDPGKPVPFIDEINIGMTRTYMTDDQRFASRRPDVMVYQTEPLDDDLTLAGPLLADLWVSTSPEGGGPADSDWIVKVIDVFPSSAKDTEHMRAGVRMGGYQMMVRSEVIRGRFRDSYEKPEPFEPGRPTRVRLPLQDVLHTFQKGHRVMVHVQSTWFPLVDRNPHKWVDNIFKASESDFVRATQRVFHDAEHASGLQVTVLSRESLDAAACPEAEGYRFAKPKDETKKDE